MVYFIISEPQSRSQEKGFLAGERKDFEDYIMWRLVELSAQYDLPFQIHTGQARIQGSNPMLLVDLIAAHRATAEVSGNLNRR